MCVLITDKCINSVTVAGVGRGWVLNRRLCRGERWKYIRLWNWHFSGNFHVWLFHAIISSHKWGPFEHTSGTGYVCLSLVPFGKLCLMQNCFFVIIQFVMISIRTESDIRMMTWLCSSIVTMPSTSHTRQNPHAQTSRVDCMPCPFIFFTSMFLYVKKIFILSYRDKRLWPVTFNYLISVV